MANRGVMFRVLILMAALAPSVASAAPQQAPSVLQNMMQKPAVQRALPVIDALKKEGYSVRSIHLTLLNRVRIRAENRDYLREIVVSPATGDILRDAIVKTLHRMPKVDPKDQQFQPVLPSDKAPSGN